MYCSILISHIDLQQQHDLVLWHFPKSTFLYYCNSSLFPICVQTWREYFNNGREEIEMICSHMTVWNHALISQPDSLLKLLFVLCKACNLKKYKDVVCLKPLEAGLTTSAVHFWKRDAIREIQRYRNGLWHSMVLWMLCKCQQ